MSTSNQTHQQMGNIEAAEKLFQQFAQEFRAAGFIVHEDHTIDPVTGQVVYMSISADGMTDKSLALDVFKKLAAANITVGIGSSLRARLWDGVNRGAIKLHDFGFRGRK